MNPFCRVHARPPGRGILVTRRAPIIHVGRPRPLRTNRPLDAYQCRSENDRMSELNKREAELWDRQVELYSSMSKNASQMYDGLQEAYTELREFHMMEKKMWLEREESLVKENQELRSTLMYVMSRMRGLETSDAEDEGWIDGTAASGGIPAQTSMDEETSSGLRDDFAAAFAAVENGDILKEDPLSYRGRGVDEAVALGTAHNNSEDEEVVSDADAPVIPTGPPPTMTVGEDDIYWVNQLHVALVDAGFFPGDEDIDDFIFGESTQSALLTFQACNGIPESGIADQATWRELLGEDLEHKKSRDLTEDMNPLTETRGAQEKPFAELFSSETLQVNVTRGSTTSSVTETHSHDEKIFADGHMEIEDTESVEVEEKTSLRTEWPVLLEGDGGKEVHALHVLLENAGYWPGEDDMQWWQYGDSTVNAIKACQACNGLPESGACDETMWQLLLGPTGSPSDIDSIQSGNSDDEDLAVDGTDTRVWLIGEQRWEDRSRIATFPWGIGRYAAVAVSRQVYRFIRARSPRGVTGHPFSGIQEWMVMSMGLDGDMGEWSTVDHTVTAHGTEDCFGQKLFESDPLMFESIGWNDAQEGAQLGFGVDLFRDTSGTHGMDAYEAGLVDGHKVYDVAPPLAQFPQQEQPLVDGAPSLHDARSGVDEQSDDSPRDSSFTRYEDRDVLKTVPMRGTVAPVVRRPPSRRNRSVPKRLADGVPSSSLSSSKSLTVKSASSEQISSSFMSRSAKKPRKKGSDPGGKDMMSARGSRFSMKTRGAKAIRATSARHESKGRPSFCELVSAGFMKPGEHKFSVGHVEVIATVGEDGAINYAGSRYRAVSKFALVVLRERNPSRQSCDGWKEVSWNGEKLDVLRTRANTAMMSNAATCNDT